MGGDKEQGIFGSYILWNMPIFKDVKTARDLQICEQPMAVFPAEAGIQY